MTVEDFIKRFEHKDYKIIRHKMHKLKWDNKLTTNEIVKQMTELKIKALENTYPEAFV